MAEADATGGKARVEAFSDGVIAILITIMILELKVPEALAHGFNRAALVSFGPKFAAYAMSFLVIAIMWVNHHAMTRTLKRVAAGYVWLNMLLLFGMSLIPLVTEFYGDNPASPIAAASYSAVLATTAWTFVAMRWWLARRETEDEALRRGHMGVLRKSLVGAALYSAAAPLAFVSLYAAMAIFVIVPAMFFLPDFLLPKGMKIID